MNKTDKLITPFLKGYIEIYRNYTGMIVSDHAVELIHMRETACYIEILRNMITTLSKEEGLYFLNECNVSNYLYTYGYYNTDHILDRCSEHSVIRFKLFLTSFDVKDDMLDTIVLAFRDIVKLGVREKYTILYILLYSIHIKELVYTLDGHTLYSTPRVNTGSALEIYERIDRLPTPNEMELSQLEGMFNG